MKDIMVLPREMLKMDDDETPYMPVWRVVINGRPHREVIEKAEQPTVEEKIHLNVPPNLIH